MLDFEPFTEINMETLRQAVWLRIIGKKPYFGDGSIPLYNPDPSITLRDKKGYMRHNIEKAEFSQPGLHLQDLQLEHDVMPTEEQVTKAFRRLAKKHHPDLDKGNPQAAQYFDQLKNSYEKVKGLRVQVEQEAAEQAERLKAHFSAHAKNLGWGTTVDPHKKSAAYFPSDHLDPKQKEELEKILRDIGAGDRHHIGETLFVEGEKIGDRFYTQWQGLATEESISLLHNFPGAARALSPGKKISGVIAVTGQPITAEEIAQKLLTKFKPLPMLEFPATESGAIHAAEEAAAHDAGKVESTLKSTVKAVEEAAEKSSGKTKWIIGGIIATTVAIGAFIALKKKKPEEYKKGHMQSAASHGIS